MNEKPPTNGDNARGRVEQSRPTAPDIETPQPRVVYRRSEPIAPGAPVDSAQAGSGWSQLAPATMPLIVGFLLVLGLITLLGVVSGWRMDQVDNAVLGLEQGHAAKVRLLLQLRLAVTKLDNEARARAEADSRRELKPPFEVRLNAARQDLKDLLAQLERPPLVNDAGWRHFYTDLQNYVEVTEDLRRYSLEGFTKFTIVDTELNAMLDKLGLEQNEIFHRSENIEQAAVRSDRKS